MTTQVPAKNEAQTPETVEDIRKMAHTVPPADIYEDAHGWTIKLDMPGVKQGNAEVGLERGVLSVTGRVEPFAARKGSEYYREYNLRNYFREFMLNEPVDENHVTAELKNGVLTINLPRTEEAKPRTIPVDFR